jgi:NADPH-dependent curcumin reductase CurA
MPGMLIFDHVDILEQAVEDLTRWLKEGTISNLEGETVVEATFEEIPEVYERLFSGRSKGKLITKLKQ